MGSSTLKRPSRAPQPPEFLHRRRGVQVLRPERGGEGGAGCRGLSCRARGLADCPRPGRGLAEFRARDLPRPGPRHPLVLALGLPGSPGG